MNSSKMNEIKNKMKKKTSLSVNSHCTDANTRAQGSQFGKVSSQTSSTLFDRHFRIQLIQLVIAEGVG